MRPQAHPRPPQAARHAPQAHASAEPPPPPPQPPRARVAVYRGEGAGWRSVQSTVAALSRLLPRAGFDVGTIAPVELLAGGWQARCALLVMPGGADLPYCKHLNGAGNRLISDFVRGGGSYLGLCAGAYYACARVEFEPGGDMQVLGDRELGFFPGTARGAAVPGFDYQTERGAAAVGLDYMEPGAVLRMLAGAGQHQGGSGASGGGGGGNTDCTGAGSGAGWQSTVDYCNGGPFFVAPGGEALWDRERLPGVDVIATYSALLPGALQRVRPRPQTGVDNNGGGGEPAARAEAAAVGAADQAVAAVRCRVGAGVAVLCGTHPELDASWLDPCGLTPLGPRAAAEAAAAAATSSSSSSSAAAAAATAAAAAELVTATATAAAAEVVTATAAAVAAAPRAAAIATAARPPGEGPRGAAAATAAAAPAPAAAAAAAPAPAAEPAGAGGAVCPDAALALHTAKLRDALTAESARRDDFLRALLVASLFHQGCAEGLA